jgi:hypothetical protein
LFDWLIDWCSDWLINSLMIVLLCAVRYGEPNIQ